MTNPLSNPERVPVIVGVGQINDRPARAEEGLDSAALMAVALRAAESDAGGNWLADVDAIYTVDQISWPQLTAIPAQLAARFAAKPAHLETSVIAGGEMPVELLNKAANRIGAGEAVICAVVGGEGMRTATQLAQQALVEGRTPPFTKLGAKSSATASPLRKRYGLLLPLEIYPLFENAGRAARGETLAAAQNESGRIWKTMADESFRSEGAWKPMRVSVDDIVTPSPQNPLLAFPFTRLMVANPSVNQGAGFIVTSLAEARRRGVAEEKIIYVGNGAAAREADDPLARDRYDRSASLTVALTQTLARNQLLTADLDYVELYSCFPCVPKMARQVLQLPDEKPVTVFGGLTFGGGPVGNYMSHAIGEMVRRLRKDGRFGLLFANGGYATHNHAIVLSSQPIAAAQFPQDFDCQPEADALRESVPPLLEEAPGAAVLETYTVLYAKDGQPKWGVIVARNAQGQRTVAKVPADDTATIAFLTDGRAEPVGAHGVIVKDTDSGDQIWRRKN